MQDALQGMARITSLAGRGKSTHSRQLKQSRQHHKHIIDQRKTLWTKQQLIMELSISILRLSTSRPQYCSPASRQTVLSSNNQVDKIIENPQACICRRPSKTWGFHGKVWLAMPCEASRLEGRASLGFTLKAASKETHREKSQSLQTARHYPGFPWTSYWVKTLY